MVEFLITLEIFLICIISIIVGWNLSIWGISIFTQPQKLGSLLLVVVIGVPVSAWLLVWLQNTYKFHAQTRHWIIIGLCFVIPYILARAAKSNLEPRIMSGIEDFRKASQIFAPFFNLYYKTGQKLTDTEQQAIIKSRDHLQQAINLFQSARDSRLHGGAITNNDKQDAAVVLVEIGLIYRLLGDLAQAQKLILQAYTELNALYPSKTLQDLPTKLGIACLRLGDLEHISGNYAQAKNWYQQAIPLLEQPSDNANLQLVHKLLSGLP